MAAVKSLRPAFWRLAATQEIFIIKGQWIEVVGPHPLTEFQAHFSPAVDGGILKTIIGCSRAHEPLVIEAVSHAVSTLGVVSRLREGIDESGAGNSMTKLNTEDLNVLEERYFGKLTTEQQDSITSILTTAKEKMMMYEMFWVCVEACAAATAGGFTVNGVTGNETVYLCPGMFDLGTSWWEIVLERDPEMRIETQAMCRSLTVVHEMMHLANRPWHGITNDRLPEFIGDVDIEHCDHPDMHYCKAYGREAAQELAKRDTTLALRNADNYAFYVADVFLAYLHGIASLDYKQEHELAENLPFVTIIPRTTEPETDISGKSSAGSNSDATSTDVDEPESTITATKGSSTDEPFGTATDMNAIVANATNTVNATDPITDIFDSILEWFGLNNSTHFNTSEGALEEEAEATSDDLETT